MYVRANPPFSLNFSISIAVFDSDKSQGFNWDSWKKVGGWYNVLKAKVGDIVSTGATHDWLPPASSSVGEQGSFLFALLC